MRNVILLIAWMKCSTKQQFLVKEAKLFVQEFSSDKKEETGLD